MAKITVLDFFLFHFRCVQAYLQDIVDSLPHHHNEVNVS